MTLKQLWSIIRGRRTNFRFANISWTYYPEGDPMSRSGFDWTTILPEAERGKVLADRQSFLDRFPTKGEIEQTGREGRTALENAAAEVDMLRAIRAWLKCPREKRPSAMALGKRIEEIASALTNGNPS